MYKTSKGKRTPKMYSSLSVPAPRLAPSLRVGTGSASRSVGQVVITSNFRASSMNFGDVCWRPVLSSDARHSPSVAVCLVLQELLVELAMVILGSAARDGCVQEGASERSPHERQLRRLEGLLWLQWSSLAQQTVRLTPCARTCNFLPLESKRVSHVAQKAGRAVATLDGGFELALQHLHYRRMAGLRVVRLSRESAPPKLMPSVYFTQATTRRGASLGPGTPTCNSIPAPLQSQPLSLDSRSP